LFEVAQLPEVRVEKGDAQAKELAPIIVEIRANGATTLQAIANKLQCARYPDREGGRCGTSSAFRLRARIDKLKGIVSARGPT
jgi:hypothetical protein